MNWNHYIFINIVVSDYELKDVFRESEALYFEWYNSALKTIINGLNTEYSKLIEVSSRSYKRSKGKKGVLEIPASYPQTDEANKMG